MDFNETARLLAALERTAKAFERIATALEKSNESNLAFHQYNYGPTTEYKQENT